MEPRTPQNLIRVRGRLFGARFLLKAVFMAPSDSS
jgi:hypothetical protein